MNQITQQSELDELRVRILAAAHDRFSKEGYGKTTMADLAADCQCSPANLYRYYPSKQDIAAAVCQQCLDDSLATLRELVRRPGTTAEARLRAYVLGGLKLSREDAQSGPKLNEFISYILEKRQDLVHARIQAQTSLIVEILAFGNESGEFEVGDVIATARSVYASLTLFEVPLFQPLYSEAEFEVLANGTVDLLLKGLGRR